ncbi:MAG: hypothetical protein RLY61_556 [Candidatus Parcubacteria bacterium]|jgi:hypothetical protein
MYERVNDKIEVLVHFTLEKPIPLALIWKGRKFKIQDINFVHVSHEGKAKIMEFALSSPKEAFNVKFNLEECSWTLCEVFFEGFIKSKSFN